MSHSVASVAGLYGHSRGSGAAYSRYSRGRFARACCPNTGHGVTSFHSRIVIPRVQIGSEPLPSAFQLVTNPNFGVSASLRLCVESAFSVVQTIRLPAH